MQFIPAVLGFRKCFLVFSNNITMIPPLFQIPSSYFSTDITVRTTNSDELYNNGYAEIHSGGRNWQSPTVAFGGWISINANAILLWLFARCSLLRYKLKTNRYCTSHYEEDGLWCDIDHRNVSAAVLLCWCHRKQLWSLWKLNLNN